MCSPMIKERSRSRLRIRRTMLGISLLEVIFATGVLLIGLLGLASVLPVASNNALQSLNNDRAKQAYQNQAALRSVLGLDNLSQMDSYFRGENSQSAYELAKREYVQWKADYERWQANGGPNQDPPVPPPTPKPRPEQFPIRTVATLADLPDAFCIDPWFLTAANTLRDDATPNRNHYDRTLFPCYEDHYPINASPSDPFVPPTPSAGTYAWSFGADPLRRLPRVGISNITSAGFHEAMAKDQDTIALVLNPDDKSLFPGIAIKRSPVSRGRRTTSILNGRYSYLMTVRRNGTGNVVVFRDRQIVINPTSKDYTQRHPLTPYDALPFATGNIPLPRRTFSDERVGYVTYVDRIFRGNGGSFTYDLSAYVDPTVDVGDWIMLIRRDYSPRNPSALPVPIPDPVPGELKFAWCRIASVDEAPTLSGNTYRTKVTVRDVNWSFHPIQDYHQFLGSGPYPGARSGQSPPSGWNGRVYDFSAVGSKRTNLGNTGTQGDPLYGTSVVLMKNIVSVQSF